MREKTLFIENESGRRVKLSVLLETEHLAITKDEEGRFAITHRPTGWRASRFFGSLPKAKSALKQIAHLNWNFGHNWPLGYGNARSKHHPA